MSGKPQMGESRLGINVDFKISILENEAPI